MSDAHSFFDAVLNAGAILSGFCGTFLTFRIQREANYYRQPALSYDHGKAKDVAIGLTRFTSAFFLIVLATGCAFLFGFILPLFAVAGTSWILSQPNLIVAGLVTTQGLLFGYFWAELSHYKILSDCRIGEKAGIVATSLVVSVVAGLVTFWVLRS